MRYGIVGRLWGSLEVIEALPIEDLSNLGARVASGRSLALDTTHAGRLMLAGQVFDLHVRVRHTDAGGVPHRVRRRYQLGLEFIGLSPTAAAEVQQLLDY